VSVLLTTPIFFLCIYAGLLLRRSWRSPKRGPMGTMSATRLRTQKSVASSGDVVVCGIIE
jgi:hypothetical protein